MSLDIRDLSCSRAMLIGTSVYRDKRFRQLPAAANSLKGLNEILADEQLCCWPADRVTALLNPEDGPELVMNLREWAQDTKDVLLLYYVGHGTITPSGDLNLALPGTKFNNPDVTGIEYRHIRAALLDSPARIKIVILDCCYAGRAIETLCSTSEVADSTAIRGTYILTASDQAAHVPPLSEQADACTSFTGELLELIRTGIPDGPQALTLNMIYSHLRAQLQGRQLPAPNQRVTDTAGKFVFTRNGALLPHPIETRYPRPQLPGQAGRTAWHKRIIAAAAVTALAVSGSYLLGRADDPASSATLHCATKGPAASASGPVVVGSGNFPESKLLGQIYADALSARNFAVTTKLGIGTREYYYPQVCAGLVTIVPEYNGDLLTTSVDPGSKADTTEQVDTALTAKLPASLAILNPATAQDMDSVTVTQATAEKYHLKSIGDLRRLPGPRSPTIGGPREFVDREQGFVGLQARYGLELAVQPLDDSGPRTIHALLTGQVQAADVFTTDPLIKKDHLLPLADPRNVFRAENIVPLVYKQRVTAGMIAVLNAVSAKLTMTALRDMNIDMTLDHDSFQTVALTWLSHVGLG